MFRRNFMSGVLAFLTIGAHAQDSKTQETWRGKVTVSESEFSQFIKIQGAESSDGRYFSQPASTWELGTLIDKQSDLIEHYIHLFDLYDGEWRFWNSATTNSAETLRFTSHSRKVLACNSTSGCGHLEEVSARLSENLLIAAQNGGVKIRFQAKSGSELIIAINSEEAKWQLQATDFYKKQLGK